MTKSVNQLINYFQPEGYALRIDARPGRREFSGQVSILGNKTGASVRLHAKNLIFTSVKVNNSPAAVIELENDEIELRPKKPTALTPDRARQIKAEWGADCDTDIAIKFTGRIDDTAMHGLYPCYYEIDGEKRELLATQFESHHAREVFPCVDEPAAKAVFRCQIDTAPDATVLGNMPIERQFVDKSGDFQRVTFAPTPRMSTYLLAFVIGDLQKISAKTARGVEVNIFATPAQKLASLDFALDTAVKCIDYYEKYFGVDYPLPKSDHIALPDFSSGAMENWGLITYRESCLLADKTTGLATKQQIATIIAHELAHQWFGNLVTMKWWNDLWLNESFASLMEHVATDALFPDWQMWLGYETGDVISALRRDALPGVQPVRQDVNHPDEISTLFDSAIVYAKGERLLKMCRAFVGEEAFRAGLRKYFAKFQYQNTEAGDLWNCLSEASGQDIASLMTPWLTRPHYPVVRASYADDKITLRQEKFLTANDNSVENADITLRELSLNDGEKELEYLRQIPHDENGFHSPADSEDLVDMTAFRELLRKKVDAANGIGIDATYVPNTVFWIERGDEIVGVVKMRHYLNDGLRKGGGHIGYGGILPKYRGQGIATKALRLAIERLHAMGEKDILITINEKNVASRKVVESNGGVLDKIIDDDEYPGEKLALYWIKEGERKVDELWSIPLFASDKNAPKLMREREISFAPADIENFQLNIGNNGHFLVSIDETLRAKITTKLADLPIADRLETLNAVTMLARAGQSSTADYLDVLNGLKSEKSWAVWDIISIMIGDLKKFVENDDAAEKHLKKMAADLVQPLFKELGVKPRKDDNDNATKLRPMILGQMVYAEDCATVDACLAEFIAHRHNIAEIAGDLRAVILAAAVKFGDNETFDYLVDIYKTTPDADLKQDICAGLTATRDSEQIDKLIANLMLTDIIRPQDLFYWFAWLLGNRYARTLVWTWCRDNWTWIVKTFGGDKSFDMFPRYAGGQLRTRAELTEFDEFFGDKTDPALQRAIAVGHNDIMSRVEWLERDREVVLEKLSSQNNSMN